MINQAMRVTGCRELGSIIQKQRNEANCRTIAKMRLSRGLRAMTSLDWL